MGYVPMLVFGIWMLYGRLRYGNPRAPENLKHPEWPVMSSFEYYDNSRWTPEGLRVRRAWTIHTFIGALLSLLAILVVTAIERRA